MHHSHAALPPCIVLTSRSSPRPFVSVQRFVIYSSWSDSIQLVNIPSSSLSPSSSDFELHEALDLKPSFEACQFGVRFSPSDLEVLAGLNRGVMILHDIERKQNIFKAAAHSNDINTVAFLDEQGAGNIFASGSDDALIKVHHTRSYTQRRSHSSLLLSPVYVWCTAGIRCGIVGRSRALAAGWVTWVV